MQSNLISHTVYAHVCVCETERKRMRTVEINSDLNPLADWTQASAKFPIPTAFPGREVTAGWIQAPSLHLHQFVGQKQKKIQARKSHHTILVFRDSMKYFAVCSMMVTASPSMTVLLLSRASIIPLFSPHTADSLQTHTLQFSRELRLILTQCGFQSQLI